MTEELHPMIPPPELVQQWLSEFLYETPNHSGQSSTYIAARAAQWGADHELEACCEWLDREGWSGESRQLRAARRPKLSLKERIKQAISSGDTELAIKLLENLDDTV